MAKLDERFYFKKINEDRASGVLMHISSLPGPYGIGSLGKNAREFVDFLYESGQKYWQMLPVGPTGYGDSPYQSFSTFAGNPYFVDLDDLVTRGLITKEEIDDLMYVDDNTSVDYGRLYHEKNAVLRLAFERFNIEDEDFLEFSKDKEFWLRDFSLFMALKEEFDGASWNTWPDDYKFRNEEALNGFEEDHRDKVNFYKFVQYMFFMQWESLKRYIHERRILTIGDLPIYVAEDSADVWVNPDLFQLNDQLVPKFVGGCPPDDFSDDGQLWGNPCYDWERNEETGFEWWLSRLDSAFDIFDCIRLDHFRGFESYWSIPHGQGAPAGSWQPGPGMKLFSKVKEKFGDLPIIAEDLGYITKEVYQLRVDAGFPSMKILQFAFDLNGESEHIPHNYNEDVVAYIGTHDNETVVGWLKNVNYENLEFAKKYFNLTNEETFCWGLIRGIWTSVAKIAIVQMQDLLMLDNSARMNAPSTLGENWKWRMKEGAINPYLVSRLRDLTQISGRLRK